MSGRFRCVYCGAHYRSPNGAGSDVTCCNEVGHVEEIVKCRRCGEEYAPDGCRDPMCPLENDDVPKVLPFESKEKSRQSDNTLPPLDGPESYMFENGTRPERAFQQFAREVDDWFVSHFGHWPDDVMKRKFAAARDDLLQRLRLHL